MTWVRRRTWARNLLLAATLACTLGVMVVKLSAVVALLAPATVGILALLVLVRGVINWPDEATRRRVLWWTMVAFAAHLLFGLAATNISRKVWFYLGTDAVGYDAVARAMVQHWNQGLPFPSVSDGKEGFYYMLAGLYWVFGAHTASGLAVNAALAAGLVPLMSDLTHRLFGPAAARFAAPLVVVLPGLFLWTSQLMRESGMLFLLAVALSCAVRLTERVTLSAFVILTTALILAFTFRAPVALILAAGLIVGIAVADRQVVTGVVRALSALTIMIALMLASGIGYLGYQTATSVNLNQADIVRKDLAYSARTGFAEEVDISTTRTALQFLPWGVFNFVLGPFPWQIREARQLPFVPDVIVWWLLLPSLWRGWRAASRLIGRRQLIMLIPALGTVLFMGLALGNFGTIVRERLQVVVLVVPLIALGLAQRGVGQHEVDDTVAAGSQSDFRARLPAGSWSSQLPPR